MERKRERRFPLLMDYNERKKWPDLPRSVPWEMVEPWREQAKQNHDQTLERLAERGGLGASEMMLASQGKGFREWPFGEEFEAKAVEWLRAELKQWETAHE